VHFQTSRPESQNATTTTSLLARQAQPDIFLDHKLDFTKGKVLPLSQQLLPTSSHYEIITYSKYSTAPARIAANWRRPSIVLATSVLLDPSTHARRPVLEVEVFGTSVALVKDSPPPRKSSTPRSYEPTKYFLNATSNTGTHTQKPIVMAGNEMDLLKQATQAMMARYDGKYPFLSVWIKAYWLF
jgi:hypothetical protein